MNLHARFVMLVLTLSFGLTPGLPSLGAGAQTIGASAVSIRVLDQNGDPLDNVVLELPIAPVREAPANVAIIDQINKRFVPMVIAIEQGQQVNFPNNDNIRHHVYSFSEIRQFSTELYADNPGEPITFDKSGIAVLGCNIHDSMVGYIFVSPWQHVAVTDASGRVTFDLGDISSLPATLQVWHPWSTDPEQKRDVSTAGLTAGGELEVILTINRPEQVFGFRALSQP